VAGGGEDGIDRVAVAHAAGEVTALDQAVGLQVPDHRLDRVAPAQLPPDRGGDVCTLLAGDEDALCIGVVAAVAAVDIGALGPLPGQPLDPRDLRCERVAVIGIAGRGADAGRARTARPGRGRC
jgi:hypothetical protein